MWMPSRGLFPGGDVRAVLLQAVMLALFSCIYLPFLKAKERAQAAAE